MLYNQYDFISAIHDTYSEDPNLLSKCKTLVKMNVVTGVWVYMHMQQNNSFPDMA